MSDTLIKSKITGRLGRVEKRIQWLVTLPAASEFPEIRKELMSLRSSVLRHRRRLLYACVDSADEKLCSLLEKQVKVLERELAVARNTPQ